MPAAADGHPSAAAGVVVELDPDGYLGASGFTQQLPPMPQVTFPVASALQHPAMVLQVAPQHAGIVAGAVVVSPRNTVNEPTARSATAARASPIRIKVSQKMV
jgi:hypothetical protein